MKFYNCINYRLSESEKYFDILLTDKNDTYDFELFDYSGINQDIITISLITDKGLIKDLKCLVHSRFGQGYVFRVIPVDHFMINDSKIKHGIIKQFEIGSSNIPSPPPPPFDRKLKEGGYVASPKDFNIFKK